MSSLPDPAVMEDEAEVLWKGWMRAPNGPAVQGQSSDEREMSKVACYSVITGGDDNSPPKLTLLKVSERHIPRIRELEHS